MLLKIPAWIFSRFRISSALDLMSASDAAANDPDMEAENASRFFMIFRMLMFNACLSPRHDGVVLGGLDIFVHHTQQAHPCDPENDKQYDPVVQA